MGANEDADLKDKKEGKESAISHLIKLFFLAYQQLPIVRLHWTANTGKIRTLHSQGNQT